jgi:RimJ/RimL family protein N-acetyltransferase
MQFPVPALVGEHVRLEPLTISHVEDLARAAGEDTDSYGFTVVPEGENAMRAMVQSQLEDFATGAMTPFAQVDLRTNLPVGMTRYLTIRPLPGASVPYAVEIGGTWLSASAQRTAINTEAKLLLLTYAFETWGVVRVDIKTDARNERAKVAIARLGASFEGVLRNWQPSQARGEVDKFRNTAMFSITSDEWPDVRAGLLAKLGRS